MTNLIESIIPSLGLVLLASLALWKVALPKLLEKEMLKYQNALELHRDKIINDLNIQRDLNQHELQKNLLIKELETKNLHSLYPQIFEDLQKLFIMMRGFFAEFAKDYTQLSDEEFLDLLTNTHEMGKAKAFLLLGDLKSNPQENNDKIRKLLFERDLRFSLDKIKRKEQFFREKSLFISEPVKNQAFIITEKLKNMWTAFRLAYNPEYRGPTDGFQKAANLEEELITEFVKLEKAMRTELKLT
jgi:hypothetical protein